MLVEDNPMDVMLVRNAAASRNLEPRFDIFDDGEQALKFIHVVDKENGDFCPDLILLDLNLPRVNGLEVLAQLRTSPRCSTVPVIIMTSSAAQEDRTKSAALGATTYFLKPSGYEEFMKLGDMIRDFMLAKELRKH
jgi:CheY-like chemotaxis protein